MLRFRQENMENTIRVHKSKYSRFFFLMIISFLIFTCFSCVVTSNQKKYPDKYDRGGDPSETTRMKTVRSLLIEGAHWAVGRSELVVRGRRFRMDCTGTIMAIYYYAGIDLGRKFHEYTGNGVSRIYHYLGDGGCLYHTNRPQPGDIIFWDNSYDRNEDGIANDELTHMGMVVSTADNGDVTYIHHNYRKGIVFASMNLLDPDNVDRNSPMRMRSLPRVNGKLWLSSHLYKTAGKGYLLYGPR